MVYIPKEHEQFDLLPKSRANGEEVFSLPFNEILKLEDELLQMNPSIHENSDEESGHTLLLAPSINDSLEAYYGKLAAFAKEHYGSELGTQLEKLLNLVRSKNVKENWSVVKYVGDHFNPEPLSTGDGLTKGRNYYWLSSKENPSYEGVIDNDEVFPYLYPCDPASWEILLDPTGMATDALAGNAMTVDSWRVSSLSEDGSFEEWAQENNVSVKTMGGSTFNLEDEHENWSSSEDDSIPITCPECNAITEFHAWRLINAQESPSAVEQLLAGTLFKFACSNCGLIANVPHPCLYLDPESGFAIYLVSDEEMAIDVDRMFRDLEKNNDELMQIHRIVGSHRVFLEKVLIFSEGFNDRGMEILKFALAGSAKAEGSIPVDETPDIYFEGSDEKGSITFQFELHEPVMRAEISRGAYDNFYSLLMNSSISEEHEYVVDRNWANRALDVLTGEGLL